MTYFKVVLPPGTSNRIKTRLVCAICSVQYKARLAVLGPPCRYTCTRETGL